LVLRDGVSKWPPPEIPVSAPPPIKARAGAKGKTGVTERVSPPPPPARKPLSRAIASLVSAVGLASLALYAPQEFIQHFTVFVLACFIGWQVVWNVTPALHTPLMSVTNAISGIILIGGLMKGASGEVDLAALLGTIAVLVASINVFGGFLVTHRILKMFRK
jgi:NAD(P) transhydrogenase subunit alpha